MSDTLDPPQCTRCGAATQYSGRISLPPKMIFRCGSCGEYVWTSMSAYVSPGSGQPVPPPAAPPEQPSVQQQQQIQPAENDDEPGSA